MNHDDQAYRHFLNKFLELFAIDIFKPMPRRREPWDAVSDDEVIDGILSLPPHYASTFAGTSYAGLAVIETTDSTVDPFVNTADPTLQFGITNNATIAGVTGLISQQKALSSGSITMDLTAGTCRQAAVSFNAKAVKYGVIRNPIANANNITCKFGAASPASTFGASWVLVLKPGDIYAFQLNTSETVDATHKNWDLTGTGSQALDILLAAG